MCLRVSGPCQHRKAEKLERPIIETQAWNQSKDCRRTAGPRTTKLADIRHCVRKSDGKPGTGGFVADSRKPAYHPSIWAKGLLIHPKPCYACARLQHLCTSIIRRVRFKYRLEPLDTVYHRWIHSAVQPARPTLDRVSARGGQDACEARRGCTHDTYTWHTWIG